MMRSFSVGIAAGVVAGAALTALVIPKKQRHPARIAAARALKTMGEIVENVGNIIRE